MGKASGYGMGPAFQGPRPYTPSKRAINAALKQQKEREKAIAAAETRVNHLATLNPRLDKAVRYARARGDSWLEIAERLADNLREAQRRADVIAKERAAGRLPRA